MSRIPPFSPRTSGDLLADRRYAYGDAAFAEGDWQAAADLFRQTIELAPHWPPAHHALARAAIRLEARVEARQALETVLRLDPDDHLGAGLLLAQLGLAGPAEAMPAAYVAALFDEYAPRFDNHLVETLQYRAPQLLCAALEAQAPGRHFEVVLDLGCGTGLMARALAGRFGSMAGFDLSAGMIEKARDTGLYARLAVADLLAALEAEPPAGADLVIAADVFCYVPDLAPVFREVRRVLAPDGLFAFTVQTQGGEGVVVGPDARLHHAPAFIRAVAATAGLRLGLEQEVISRLDAGRPVPGALYLLAQG